MTPLQAKKRFIALAQPYWIKSMTSIKQMFEKEEKKYPEGKYEDWYEPPSKVANKYLKMAKSGRFRALEWDYSDLVPDGFYNLVNYDRNDYDTWATTAAYFEGPKSVQKQLKALLPIIEGKAPKARAKTTAKKPKTKAKSGRKAPEISATRRKIGTRMRGNDGNMWEVKPAGKSQRWVRGAEDWGGDPEGQLAQALARAREAPAPAPLEITELPKICRTCGDSSPQAFGIFDEDDNLITESWFCNTVCADQHPIAKGQSFGAEGDYNDFISGLEAYLTKFGYLDHFEAEYGNGVLSGSFSVDIDNPEEFGDVEFDAESIEESDYMVITEDTELPDADSWILYLADPEKFPRGDYDPRFAELFFVTGPGQFVDTNKYIRTARVMGGYAPFMISQNIDETGWLKSPTTIANYLGTDSARSLSVGDIVCNPDTGICYIVANFGYHRLEPTTETFEAPLARHNLKRFQPANFKKKAGYWRKRGRDSIFGRDKNDR